MEYRKRRDIISSVKNATSELPEKLFHYTAPDAAISILTKQKLWASSAAFMNDTSEMFYTLDIAKTLIIKRIEAKKYGEETIRFLVSLNKYLEGRRRRAYVISFTELPDSLSQWRAYCPTSGGYAIGFFTPLIISSLPPQVAYNDHFNPPADIIDALSKNGFKLVQCIYEPDKHQEIITQAINDCIDEFEYFVSREGAYKYNKNNSVYSWTTSSLEHFATDCADYIQEISLIIKHEGFKEEKEWRLVHYFRMSGPIIDPPHLLSFRATPKGIMPYIEYSLASTSVIIGPCSNPKEREDALLFLMLSLGYGGSDKLSIKLSATPYKSW